MWRAGEVAREGPLNISYVLLPRVFGALAGHAALRSREFYIRLVNDGNSYKHKMEHLCLCVIISLPFIFRMGVHTHGHAWG